MTRAYAAIPTTAVLKFFYPGALVTLTVPAVFGQSVASAKLLL